jgi:hypothetical protein
LCLREVPEDGSSKVLRNVNILSLYYTVSQPEDGGSKVLRNVGILPQHNTISQPEDGGRKVLRNVGILPHHYTISQPEDGSRRILRNVGILPHHYTASRPRRPRLQMRRYCVGELEKMKQVAIASSFMVLKLHLQARAAIIHERTSERTDEATAKIRTGCLPNCNHRR